MHYYFKNIYSIIHSLPFYHIINNYNIKNMGACTGCAAPPRNRDQYKYEQKKSMSQLKKSHQKLH